MDHRGKLFPSAREAYEKASYAFDEGKLCSYSLMTRLRLVSPWYSGDKINFLGYLSVC